MYVLAALVVGVVVGYLRLKKQQRHSMPVRGMSSSVASTKYNRVPTAAPEEAAAGWDDGWDNDNGNDDGWEDQSGGRYAPREAWVAALGSRLHAAVAPRCRCVQKLRRNLLYWCCFAAAVHAATGIVLVVMTAQAPAGETRSKEVEFRTLLRQPQLRVANQKSQSLWRAIVKAKVAKGTVGETSNLISLLLL